LDNIRRKIVRKTKCFGMTILATKKTIIAEPTYVDELLPSYDLKDLLEKSDFVVISVPLTSKTKGMIGARVCKY